MSPLHLARSLLLVALLGLLFIILGTWTTSSIAAAATASRYGGSGGGGGSKPKFCGKALNDMLDLVCVNGFYPKIKRNPRQASWSEVAADTETLSYPISSKGPVSTNKLQATLLHKRFADLREVASLSASYSYRTDQPIQKQLEPSRRRRRRHRRFGIVHECCHNGCVYTDIIKYCR